MNKYIPILFFAAFLMLVSSGVQAQISAYHPPQTPPEQALANLFKIDAATQGNFLSTTLNDFLPGYDPIRARQYLPLFTPALAATYRAESQRLYQKCVGSRFRLCFAPPALSCSMNAPANVSFRTISDNGHVAQIAYSWRGKEDGGQYTLVNVGGYWRLDNFSCLLSAP